MDGLAFRAEDHTYRLDGASVPGVTTALKLISAADYAHVDPALMERAAALGTDVHKLIELDCLNELDVDALHPDLLPYYQGWREFLSASGFVVLLSESKVASRRHRYAGQLDLFGKLNGVLSMVDAKRVARVMPSTGPQTMAYTNALRECRPDALPVGAPCRRYALQLRPPLHPGRPARWTLHPFVDDAADLRVFLSCLNICHYLRSKK